jgi:hypothetical protein
MRKLLISLWFLAIAACAQPFYFSFNELSPIMSQPLNKTVKDITIDSLLVQYVSHVNFSRKLFHPLHLILLAVTLQMDILKKNSEIEYSRCTLI